MTNHITKPATVQAAKNQARLLRADLAKEGTQISHSRALELVAHQSGFNDWNTFQAVLGAIPNDKTASFEQMKIGQAIGGIYLGQKFEGTLIGIQILSDGSRFRVMLDLKESVDVVQFESFSALRKRISGTVNTDGRSTEKTSDGQPQLILELSA